MVGVVHRLTATRGFGFIRPDGGQNHEDHFFHASQLVGLIFTEKLIGTRVEFDSAMAERGLAATNIRKA